MTTYNVLTTKEQGGTILLKTTEKYEEAVDYVEQCQRGTDRFLERNPNAFKPEFYFEEVPNE